MTARPSAALEGLRVLGIEETTLGGRPAARLEYAYLAGLPQGAAAGGAGGRRSTSIGAGEAAPHSSLRRRS